MFSTPSPAVFLLPLLLLSLACGSEEQDAPPPKSETCKELQLEAGEARPLQRLRLEGVPAGFGEILAAKVLSPGGAESLTLVARDEEPDEIWLHAPIHPEVLIQGGAVELQLIDAEGKSCPALPFRILPLKAAPGSVAATADRIRRQLDGVAAFFGTTIEALRELELREIPTHLLPLYLAQDSLEGPTNPNSLQALLDGSAPSLEGEALSLPLLDALFGEIGIVALLDESLEDLAQVPDPAAIQPILLQESEAGPQNAYQLHAEMEMARWGESFSGDGPVGRELQWRRPAG